MTRCVFRSPRLSLPHPTALSVMGMGERSDTAPPVPPPPHGVVDAASDSRASSHSDTSAHNDDPLE